MDRVHKVEEKPWIHETLIRLELQLYYRKQQLDTNDVCLAKDSLMDSDHGDLEERLEEFGGRNEGFVRPCFQFNTLSDKALVESKTCKLSTFHAQLEQARKMISNRAHKSNYLKALKTKRNEMLMRRLAANNKPGLLDISYGCSSPIAPGLLTALVVVQMWSQPSKNAKIKLEKEVIFRIDQTLDELRDQFKCQRDFGVPMDLSEKPDHVERVYRGEMFKSGFFLIGSTFYDDMRDPNNAELSRAIVEWSQKEISTVDESGDNVKISRGIGPFRRARMELSKFKDLEFKLGYPYLYLHQGECEHLFSISDIRYLPDDTDLQLTKFPQVTATSIGRKEDYVKCYICKSLPPHWYTRNNSRLPLDPFLFCENCFYSFNYTADKKKIGDFQAYLYTSAVGIPDNITMTTDGL